MKKLLLFVVMLAMPVVGFTRVLDCNAPDVSAKIQAVAIKSFSSTVQAGIADTIHPGRPMTEDEQVIFTRYMQDVNPVVYVLASGPTVVRDPDALEDRWGGKRYWTSQCLIRLDYSLEGVRKSEETKALIKASYPEEDSIVIVPATAAIRTD